MAGRDDMLITVATTAALLLLVQRLARLADAVWLQRVGWRSLLATTGWLGVPVHEGAHLIACLLTRRRIVQWRLLAPDARTGVLGYVVWQPGSGPLAWLTELLVGFAPLAASLALMLLLAWLEGGAWPSRAASPDQLLRDLRALAGLGAEHVQAGGWMRTATLLRLYALVAIAAHGVPSTTDLAGTWRGLLLLATLALAVWGSGRLLGFGLGIQLLTFAAQLCGALLPALAIALAAVVLRGLVALAVPQRG